MALAWVVMRMKMRVSKDRGSGMEASMTLFESVAMMSIEYCADGV